MIIVPAKGGGDPSSMAGKPYKLSRKFRSQACWICCEVPLLMASGMSKVEQAKPLVFHDESLNISGHNQTKCSTQIKRDKFT